MIDYKKIEFIIDDLHYKAPEQHDVVLRSHLQTFQDHIATLESLLLKAARLLDDKWDQLGNCHADLGDECTCHYSAELCSMVSDIKEALGDK